MLTAVIFGMCAGSVAPNQISRDPQPGQNRANRAKSGKIGCVLRSCFFIVLNLRATAVFSMTFSVLIGENGSEGVLLKPKDDENRVCTKRAPNLIVWHRLFWVMFR